MSVQTIQPAKTSGATIGILLSLTLLEATRADQFALSLATPTFWTATNIENH